MHNKGQLSILYIKFLMLTEDHLRLVSSSLYFLTNFHMFIIGITLMLEMSI